MKSCPRCKAEYPDYAMVCPLDGIGLISSSAHGAEDPLLSTTLDNRYKIISKIGEGGMGSVYLAEHIVLQRTLAVKVLRNEFAADEEATRRFTNEARVASKLGHDNIVEISDFGKTPNGSFYYVMEYLPGNSLAELISKFGRLPIQRCLHITGQIAKALAVAHKNGVIHRDLKPENIFLLNKDDKRDFVKILDFGIAKMRSMKIEKADRQTASGVIMGTPAFMSPEQASGKDVDSRTDMYSLGVIMYEMLTGKLPFDSENVIKTLVMHQTQVPAPPSAVRAEINPGLEQIVMRCLEKRPESRFRDMEELLSAIELAESNQPAPQKSAKTNDVQYNDPNALYLPQVQLPEVDMDTARSAFFVDPSQVWYDDYQKPQTEIPAPQTPKKPAAERPDENAPKRGQRQVVLGDEFDDSHFGPTEANDSLELNELPREQNTGGIKPSIREGDFLGRRRVEPEPTSKGSSMAWLIILGLIIGAAIFFGVKKYLLAPALDDQHAATRQGNVTASEQPEVKRPEKPPEPLRKSTPSEPSGLDKDTLTVYNNAASELENGRPEKAAKGYLLVLKKYPDFPDAHLGLADAYTKMGKKETAIKQYETYLEFSPSGPGAAKAKALINQYYGR